MGTKEFSSPLSGTFFQYGVTYYKTSVVGFRPLSRGLFFNGNIERSIAAGKLPFSSPLSGTFFQYDYDEDDDW